jgi:hypothetical protein
MNKNPFNIENPVFSDVVTKLNEEFFLKRFTASGALDILHNGAQFNIVFDKFGNDEIHFGEERLASHEEIKTAMPKGVNLKNWESDKAYNSLLTFSKKRFNEYLDSFQSYKFN